ncbi:MAG: hypothetical protein NTW56_14680 [Alphaproteobacteria bacterium]|nr:hypothetical protein [Alphaproteobacteria bacterium]
MAADANRTRRMVSSASGCPLPAIAPMFHTTGMPVSRLVVLISSTALRVLLGDGGHHAFIQLAADGAEQRQGVGHRVIEQGGQHATADRDIGQRDLGIDAPQPGIPCGPEKGEGRGQRAGGDAGDQLEARAVLPGGEQAGAEGPILATAGDGQQVEAAPQGGGGVGRALDGAGQGGVKFALAALGKARACCFYMEA